MGMSSRRQWVGYIISWYTDMRWNQLKLWSSSKIFNIPTGFYGFSSGSCCRVVNIETLQLRYTEVWDYLSNKAENKASLLKHRNGESFFLIISCRHTPNLPERTHAIESRAFSLRFIHREIALFEALPHSWEQSRRGRGNRSEIS